MQGGSKASSSLAWILCFKKASSNSLALSLVGPFTKSQTWGCSDLMHANSSLFLLAYNLFADIGLDDVGACLGCAACVWLNSS